MRRDQIDQFVNRLTTVTFQPPQRLTPEAQAEQVKLIALAAERALPASLSFERAQAALDRAAEHLALDATTRAWPLPAEVAKAVRAACPQRDAGPAGDHDARLHALRVGHAADWWRKRGDLPGWWNTPEIAAALVERGVCTADELRAAQCATPAKRGAAA